jgi:hypothetical protein
VDLLDICEQNKDFDPEKEFIEAEDFGEDLIEIEKFEEKEVELVEF